MNTTYILPGLETPKQDFWVFGYGSLIWNPGFDFIDKSIAKIRGYNRKFCLQSTRYRGTEEFPGLVLGLDQSLDGGGSCTGMAFKVPACNAVPVFEYLFEREMVRYAYHPHWIQAQLDKQESYTPVLSFVVDRSHNSYKGNLSDGEIVSIISRAVGPNGPNRAYLQETVDALKQMGVTDKKLESLLKDVCSAKEA